MVVIVFSDSHGNPEGMRRALRLHKKCSEIARVVFLGDGILDFEDVMADFPELPYTAVVGNRDGFSSAMSASVEEYFTVGGVKFMATHGHRYGVKRSYEELAEMAALMECKIALFGHTHLKLEQVEETPHGYVKLVNPGSVSDWLDPSYAVIDVVKGYPVVGFGRP